MGTRYRQRKYLRMRRPAGRSDEWQFAPQRSAEQLLSKDLKLSHDFCSPETAALGTDLNPNSLYCGNKYCKLKTSFNTRWCSHHNPYPKKVTLQIAGTSSILRRDGEGVWQPSSKPVFLDNPNMRRMITEFANTKEELRNYAVTVICEMLTRGDIPPYPDYIELAAWGVRKAGCSIGAQGDWLHDERDVPWYSGRYETIEAMAATTSWDIMSGIEERTSTLDYLYKWHPDHLFKGPRILQDDTYEGEDGKMLIRYLTQMDPPLSYTRPSKPSATQSLSVSISWGAAYIISQCHPSELMYRIALLSFPTDSLSKIELHEFFKEIADPMLLSVPFRYPKNHLLFLAKMYNMRDKEAISRAFKDYLKLKSDVTPQTLRNRLNKCMVERLGFTCRELDDATKTLETVGEGQQMFALPPNQEHLSASSPKGRSAHTS